MERMEQLQAWLKRLPVERILWLVSIVLVALSAQQAARLTWQLLTPLPPPPAWEPARVSSAPGDGGSGIDLQGILGLSLFGEYQAPARVAPPPQVVTTAPKTRLNLQLAGVVASSDPSRSLAIIANRGNQETYFVDDDINGTQASVYQIFADRVILDNGGRFETLYLDDAPQGDRAAIQRTRAPARPAPQVVDAPAELLQNPAKITEMVNISPVQQDGELVGYRVNPGKDPALFQEVGLEPNDLAVSINGYDLTDNEQAMQMLSELPDLTELTLTVERDGQLHQVFISLQQ